jgi:hypothetical protein
MALIPLGFIIFVLVYPFQENIQFVYDPVILVTFLLTGSCFLVIGMNFYHNSYLYMDAQGIRRPGLLRPARLPWETITGFDLTGPDLLLYRTSGKPWTISLHAYRDPWHIITGCIDGMQVQLSLTLDDQREVDVNSGVLPEPMPQFQQQPETSEGTLKLVAGLGVIVLIVLVILVPLSPPCDVGDWVAVIGCFVLAFGGVGIGLGGIWFDRRFPPGYVQVTDTALTQVRPHRRELTLRWEEISSVTYRPLARKLLLQATGHTRAIQIDGQTHDFVPLVVIIHRKLQAIHI